MYVSTILANVKNNDNIYPSEKYMSICLGELTLYFDKENKKGAIKQIKNLKKCCEILLKEQVKGE